MKTEKNIFEEAREEIIKFTKSELEQPSSRMVAAINDFFRSIGKGESQMEVESAVEWRKIAAQRLLIELIKDFANDELQKAEKVLNSIAGTFATVRNDRGDWRAYVALDGMTADKLIDSTIAASFKKGRLSMDEFIEKIFPNGIPEQEDSRKEKQRIKWRV